MIIRKSFSQFIKEVTAVVPPKKGVLPTTAAATQPKMALPIDTSKAFSTPAPSGGYGGTAAVASKPTAFSPAPTPTPKPELTAAGNNKADLDTLRQASAKATMTGPSKEAQSLMSTRTKNILGPEKLSAGISAQQGVETMRSSMPSSSSTSLPAANPTLATATQNPNVVKPSTTVSAKPSTTLPVPQVPTAPVQPKTGLSDAEKQRIDDFRALGPLQKLQQKSQLEKELASLSPEQRQQVMDYYKR